MESKSLTNSQELHGIHHAATMRDEWMTMAIPVKKELHKIEENQEAEGSSKSGSFDPDAETP